MTQETLETYKTPFQDCRSDFSGEETGGGAFKLGKDFQPCSFHEMAPCWCGLPDSGAESLMLL